MSAKLFVFRLAKHPQLVASSCEYQIPLAFGKPPGKEETLSIFFGQQESQLVCKTAL
jgi:hypothetical protein